MTPRIDIEFSADEPAAALFSVEKLLQAARNVLQEAETSECFLSLSLVDDPTIHQLNRQHLQHDYPTDVISFVYQHDSQELAGEVIVSWQTAAREAKQRPENTAERELLLYVIHGCLHLLGYDDTDAASRQAMREGERRHFQKLGLAPPSWEASLPEKRDS